MNKKRELHVIQLASDGVIKKIDVTGRSDREVKKIMSGMLINMDTDHFRIDDVETVTRRHK